MSFERIKKLFNALPHENHSEIKHGNTALHEAAWRGFSRSVEFLCKSKSNYYLRNRGGFSPLHLCCQNGHNESCRMLLRAGCKPNIKNNYGDSPLHTAARYGHAGVARILISASCNPDLQNKNGDTPLHIAAAMGRRKLARILLESGPNLEMKNQQNETSLDIAKRKNHDEIAELIANPPPVQPKDHLMHKLSINGGIEIADGVEVVEHDYEERCSKKKHKKSKNRHIHYNSRKATNRPGWSPYGCHYFPDPSEFPEPNPDTLPDEPLSKGEQYYLDLAGNIKKGPMSNGYTCYCAPLIERVEKKMDKNKREMFKHLDFTHGKLAHRINHLEKKTKDQLSNLSNNMKETFAQERMECQDRMERRAIRDRVHRDHQESVRDMMLRDNLTEWLERRIGQLERSTAYKNSQDAAFMRTLLRSSKHRKRAFWAELRSGAELRRAASDDYLPGDDANNEDPDRLKVSDHPNYENDDLVRNPSASGIRVRRNSAGDEMFFCDIGDFNTRELTLQDNNVHEDYPPPRPLRMPAHKMHHFSLYHQNGLPTDKYNNDVTSYSTNSESQYNSDRSSSAMVSPATYPWQTKTLSSVNAVPKGPPVAVLPIQRPVPTNPGVLSRMPFKFPDGTRPPLLPPKQVIPPPYRAPPFQELTVAHNARPSYFGGPETFMGPNSQLILGKSKTISDGGNSHDSHNDSGYCTRPGGGSGGPSPSLSGSQGRPDSRGPVVELTSDVNNPFALCSNPQMLLPHSSSQRFSSQPTTSVSTSGGGIAPRIRQLQHQLSLSRIGANSANNESDAARGSLV